MNDLEKYFTENPGRLMHKWMHYFEIYDRHFSRFRNTNLHIVEFGVSQGGSLQMWKEYFGPECKIYGVDINPHCKQLEEDQVQVFIGDQQDRAFLKSLAESIPRIDILIDDGGHSMKQQINTFEELFPHIDQDGVYLCEDCHTSYSDSFDGGYKRRGTFIEYSKNFIDFVNAWHSETGNLPVSEFTRAAHSLHYYDSVVVIEKRSIDKPVHKRTGVAEIPDYEPPKTQMNRIYKELKRATRPIKRLFSK